LSPIGRASAVVVAIAGLVMACAPAATLSPSVAVVPSPSVAPSSASPDGLGLSPSSSTLVAIDPSLLSILPPSVDGVPLLPAPEAAAQIAADPALPSEIDAVATALAVASGTSVSNDLAIVNVVRLNEGIFDDEFFRDWRDSYNEAACRPAGGVVGSAEAQIGGRQVFITTCTNGGATYHTHYRDQILVAITSLGPARFGEKIMSNLAD
jgi:hypothetical protein